LIGFSLHLREPGFENKGNDRHRVGTLLPSADSPRFAGIAEHASAAGQRRF